MSGTENAPFRFPDAHAMQDAFEAKRNAPKNAAIATVHDGSHPSVKRISECITKWGGDGHLHARIEHGGPFADECRVAIDALLRKSHFSMYYWSDDGSFTLCSMSRHTVSAD
jgi:hypothetical protein